MDSETLKFINPKDIRTRFAPAPTGLLHLGNARSALFNYLFAKKHQGTFVLRIEDTDKERSKPEYERDVLENLKWLGINWDEGPDPISQREIGEIRNYIGDYEPYRQSERTEIYKKYLEKLLTENKAYFCFCSEEELESQKQYQLSRGEAPKYSGKCQNLTEKEIENNFQEGKSSVIRFKISPKKVKFKDLIRGEVEFDMGLAGDIVIAKNLRYPLFVLAGVIDDFEMEISHIIRGEDHLSNTPKQILIQEALGFPTPEYAHLPLILGSDRTKLSKRHDAVAICEYRDLGYLPEALVNFIAFLGWNPGTEREIYSMNSLVKEFSLERVQKGAAVSNVKRLDFLNGFYIRQKSIEKLTEMSLPYLIKAGLIEESADSSLKESDPEKLKLFSQTQPQFKNKETGETIGLDKLEKIVAIYRERLKKISEIPELTVFFFRKKIEYDKELLRWGSMSDNELKIILDKLEKILAKIKESDWTKENLEEILILESEKSILAPDGEKGERGKLLWPFRVALTGMKATAGPFEIAEILGKQKTLIRLKEAKQKL